MIATRSWSRILQILPLIPQRILALRTSKAQTEHDVAPKAKRPRKPGVFECWEMTLVSQANLVVGEFKD